MTKALLIGIAVVIIIIIGAGAVYMSSSQKSGTETTDSEEASTEEGSSGSLKNLLASAIPQQCTFEDTTNPAAASQGRVYVSQQKMRGDFTTTANGQTQQAHIIVDGEKTYIWIEGQTQGFVASLSASDQSAAPDTSKSVDLDKQVKYSCRPWVPDSSKFTRPTTVQFTDFTALPAGAGAGSSGDIKNVQCSACASAPAESQAQCLAALGCN